MLKDIISNMLREVSLVGMANVTLQRGLKLHMEKDNGGVSLQMTRRAINPSDRELAVVIGLFPPGWFAREKKAFSDGEGMGYEYYIEKIW